MILINILLSSFMFSLTYSFKVPFRCLLFNQNMSLSK
nr:hypothetical protein TDPV-310 [Oriental turtle dovepox virus]